MPPKQSNKGSSSNKMPKKGGKMKPKTNGKGKAKKDERKKPNPFQRRVVVDKDTSKIHKSLFKKGKTAEEKELENMLFGSHFESDSIEYALGHVPEEATEDTPDEQAGEKTDVETKGKTVQDRARLDMIEAFRQYSDSSKVVNLSRHPSLSVLKKHPSEKIISTLEFVIRQHDYAFKKGQELAKLREKAFLKQRKEKERKELELIGEDIPSDLESDYEDDARVFVSQRKNQLRLDSGQISITQMKHATTKSANAAINNVEFHPEVPLLLVATRDKRLQLINDDGRKNAILKTIFIKDFPILSAHFSGNGDEVIMSADRGSYIVYDIPSDETERYARPHFHKHLTYRNFAASPNGDLIVFYDYKTGRLQLVDAKTKRWIKEIRNDCEMDHVAFSGDSSFFLAIGDGQVFHFDTATHELKHRHDDYATLKAYSVAVSRDGSLFATGDKSGMVNLYRTADALLSAKPTPLHVFKNLTTVVDSLAFSHDNQLLVMASSHERNAVRIAHTPSLSVYGNWPTEKDYLNRVMSIAFSPTSGYLVLGNSHGLALQYRVDFYKV